jgi:hypothetical protein
MRTITGGMFITLDGVIEAPEKWNPPFYDEELNRAVMPQLASADTHLHGRCSYELFRAEVEAAWPHCLRRQRAEIRFAGHRAASSCWRTHTTGAW